MTRPIPSGFEGATFDGIKPKLSQAIVKAVAEQAWPVFIHGKPGTGKSFALALFYAAWKQTQHAYWYPLETFVADVTQCRGSGHVAKEYNGQTFDRTESTLWRFAGSDHLWCVDDFGTRDVTNAGFEIVFRLMDTRARLPTIVTSNLSLSQVATLYDERISSRLGAGTVIEVTGADRRKGRRVKV